MVPHPAYGLAVTECLSLDLSQSQIEAGTGRHGVERGSRCREAQHRDGAALPSSAPIAAGCAAFVEGDPAQEIERA
jgi:hypothetical protein